VVDDLAGRVDELTRRVQRLEDERAVVDVLTRYGFAVDSDEADATAAMYAEDCTVEIDGTIAMRNRADMAAMVRGPRHQSLLPRCAHQMGPFSVRIDGDVATATGYGRVYLRTEDGFGVFRVSAGRWELHRRGDGWEIAHRWTRAIGTADAQRLLHDGL
jgi:ketosteroid isomerase-like protein